MPDRIIRGTASKEVRFFIADTTSIVKKAVKIHNLSMTNSVVLGKLLSTAVIMGSDMKSEKDVLTIRIEADGPSGNAIATTDAKGRVKGLVSNPENELPLKEGLGGFNESTAIGKGSLSIIKDLGLKAPYVGNIGITYGDIAQDLTYYYAKSEQTPTSLGLGVLIFPDGSIKKAGGFMIQLLPGCSDKVIDILEDNLRKFPHLTDVMDMGYTLEHIIEKMVLKGLDVKFHSEHSPKYHCGCGKRKMKNALKLLSKKDIKETLDESGFVEVNCHFCNKSYRFDENDLKGLLK